MAGFGFAAPDYLTRAQAGMPVDASDPAFAAQPPPGLPQIAPQGAPSGPYKPSAWDVAQGVLFNGQSPAEAAMAARGREYQTRQMAMVAQALQNAPPAQRLAMLLNPGKFGEEWAKNFAPVNAGEGSTETMYGGPAAGGQQFTAPKMVFDEKRGVYATQTPNAYTRTGLNDGDYSLSPTGAEISSRSGLTGRTVSLPQLKPLSSSLEDFTPGLSGPGLPAISPAAGANGKGAASPATGGPRGIRNLNFGNVRPLADGRLWSGQTGVDPDGYAIFATPADGVRAADTNLQSYAKQGINTPLAIAQRWAPAGDGKNDPKAYAGYISGKLGVHPTDPIDLGDPNVRQTVLRGIFDFENGPAAMASFRAPAPQGQKAGGATIRTLAGATPPAILDPADPANAGAYKNVPPGTVLKRDSVGETSVLHEAEFSPSVRAEIRGKFMSSDPYNQHIAAASALSALQHNIGQMTGPAAYTILDTMARTINPGAVARQGTISAIEGMFGLPAKVVGGLQNAVGQGKIPMETQQQILNAVTPFAQSHYDEAKRLYDSNAAIAKTHKLDPNELTAPLGERPTAMFVAVPPGPQRQPGALYVTPKGPMKWTGTGWRPAS